MTNHRPIVPGSVAHQIIALLQRCPPGAALTAREIAEHVDVLARNVYPNVAAAMSQKLVERVENAGIYRLRLTVEGRAYNTGVVMPLQAEPLPAAEPASAEHVKHEPAALEPERPETDDERADMEFAYWSTGEVMLTNVDVRDDGHLLLSAERAQALHDFLVQVMA